MSMLAATVPLKILFLNETGLQAHYLQLFDVAVAEENTAEVAEAAFVVLAALLVEAKPIS